MIKRRGSVGLADEVAIEEFAAAADKPSLPAGSNDAPARLDKKAKPTSGLNLRFNKYQHQLLKRVAEQEDVSMQKVINRVLWPALEELEKKGGAGTPASSTAPIPVWY